MPAGLFHNSFRWPIPARIPLDSAAPTKIVLLVEAFVRTTTRASNQIQISFSIPASNGVFDVLTVYELIASV